jgi:hypothetical protein
MKFKRVFTFGCSFTSYSSPTWADIVGWDLKIPIVNYGIAGMGNVGIFHRMVECDLENNFNEDDLILVVWSTWSREDRYNGRWLAGGNIFYSPYYDEKFTKKYWSMSNDIIKNSTAIISANRMFNIQFQGHIMPPYRDENLRFTDRDENLRFTEFNNHEKKILDLYKPHIPTDNVFYYNRNTKFNELFGDSHPDILQHLNYVKQFVYPSLNLTIKKETEDLCHSLHEEFINLLQNKGSNMADNDKKQMIQKMTPELIKKFKN